MSTTATSIRLLEQSIGYLSNQKSVYITIFIVSSTSAPAFQRYKCENLSSYQVTESFYCFLSQMVRLEPAVSYFAFFVDAVIWVVLTNITILQGP